MHKSKKLLMRKTVCLSAQMYHKIFTWRSSIIGRQQELSVMRGPLDVHNSAILTPSLLIELVMKK